ncbi:MAG: site-specific DNA-methyltransferase [Actinomycetota bacterium]
MLNQLFYGDNLAVLRKHIKDETVDLVYLDPPFNSNRTYNVLFKQRVGSESQAQIQAFDDTWTWNQESEAAFSDLMVHGSPRVADTVEAMRKLLGDNDLFAYLVMMTARLVELRRVLKNTGSLYLHCDPTASHYLKVILDAVFGIENFRSEITWVRTTTHNDAKRWSPNADVILYYGKSDSVTWNPVHLPHSPEYVSAKYKFDDGDGRRYMLDNMTSPNPRPNLTYEWKGHAPPPNGWRYSRETMQQLDSEGRIWYPDSKEKRPRLKRYIDEQSGVVAGNVWTDISPINSRAAERLGYPTQKPLALLERIISASSNPGDTVLDPFCGCGTTVDAAQRLERRWLGIDITTIAVDLIKNRLLKTYGDEVAKSFEVVGIPRDIEGARELFAKNPFDFERWAVSLVGGTPNERQVGDRGSDGIIRFATGSKSWGKVIISVKGGVSLNPGMVRDLAGTLEAQKAEIGVMIVMDEVTKGMREAMNHSGIYHHEMTGENIPKVQIISVRELLDGKRIRIPNAIRAYTDPEAFGGQQPSLFD